MAEFGLATWFRGSETVRGFSCSLGLCALSSGEKNKIQCQDCYVYKKSTRVSDNVVKYTTVSLSGHKAEMCANGKCRYSLGLTMRP